jgi:uncharacterized protein (DUF4213/DUF364 family)
MTESAAWTIYDRLIDSIPEDILVEDCLVGIHWILVQSIGIGVAMTPPDTERTVDVAGSIRGMRVRELAKLAKSWNFMEASIGMAAINSVTNAHATVMGNWGSAVVSNPEKNVFEYLLPRVTGKKVAVVGHFPGLKELASVCRLSILERRPQPGDFPDSACEYILPQQDFVLITGTALVNKTFPRLAALSKDAHVALVGPTTPLHPVFFESGVSLLGGTIVDDREGVWKHVAEVGIRTIFEHGARRVNVERGALTIGETPVGALYSKAS